LTTACLLAAALLAGCYRPWASLAAPAEIWRAHREGQLAIARDLQPGEGRSVLEADDLEDLAVAASPGLRALRAEVGVAEAAIGQAWEVRNPSLRVTEFQLDDAIDGEPRVEVGMRLPIPRPGVGEARGDAARQGLLAKQGEIRVEERRVRLGVRALRSRLGLLGMEAGIADEQAKVRARQRDIRERLLGAGHGTRLDHAESRLAYAEAADRATQVKVEIVEVLADLGRRTGLEPGTFEMAPLEGALEPTPPEGTGEEALVARVLETRPELMRDRARVLEAGARVYEAQASQWPWFDFAEIGYELQTPLSPYAFAFAIGIEVPIFSWGTGSIATARAEVGRREAEVEATVIRLAREVQTARTRVETTWARLEELRARLLPAAQAQLEVAREARVNGTLDELGELEAAHRWLDARRREVQAVRAYQEARLELEGALH
jgi:outer membrane protein TolC